MAQRKFQKSFIPRTPGSGGSAKRSVGSSSGMSLPMLVSIIIFLLSVALALGIFLYQQYLKGSIEEKKETLAAEAAKIDDNEVKQLVALDKRLRAAREIVDRHLALSHFFELLETETLESHQFGELALSASNDGRVEAAMSARTDTFGSAAVQADVLSQEEKIQDALFSNITITETSAENGDERFVEYSINALIRPEVVLYKEYIEVPEEKEDEEEVMTDVGTTTEASTSTETTS